MVGKSGRGSGEDQERAGLFVLHPEFGHLAGLWSVTGAHEGEQSALTWKAPVLAAIVGVPGFGDPGRHRICRAGSPKAKLAAEGVPSG